MRYGFLLDQTKCIGCHACTVACKAEHEVPLGAFRTWVTYVEAGTFPEVRRHFQVNRCNHCERAPCVAICPTGALFARADGIVDFDRSRCIGCKACIAACPYDALYIDPVDATAAKCNFCAHRVDAGMLPACVVVCPEQAIVAGDLDDPTSLIHRTLQERPTEVRKPEQGTKPKVFYLGAAAATLDPLAAPAGTSYAFAERRDDVAPATPAPAGARRLYDAPHLRRPWGARVAWYLGTKSLAAGAGGVAALALLARPALLGGTGLLAALLGLLFLLATAALLVADLKRPERFWYLFVRPNRSSWLVRGGVVLTLYGATLAAWAVLAAAGLGPPAWLLAAAAALAGLSAGYSAFLFRQAEARLFWRSPLVTPHLLVQAALAGCLLLPAVRLASGGALPVGAVPALAVLVALHVAFALAEAGRRTSPPAARLAEDALVRGELRALFWGGTAGAGGLALLTLGLAGLAGSHSLFLLAAAFALVALLAYEHAWVAAGQVVPLS